MTSDRRWTGPLRLALDRLIRWFGTGVPWEGGAAEAEACYRPAKFSAFSN